jgi:hypothetical protein
MTRRSDVEHPGDGRSRDLVITSDHRDANSPAMTLLNGLDRFLARRIEQSDQAVQNEVPRQIGRRQAVCLFP